MIKPSFKIFILTIALAVAALDAQAACVIRNSNGQPASVKNDPLFAVLLATTGCPQNVRGLKAALAQAGLATQPYMVANRGIHNPELGSFSFFEEVTGTSMSLNISLNTGEFYFGHFTGADNGVVVSDQEQSNGKLLIELIVWDGTKNLFNFYELIGTGKGGQWFYRGDSADVLADNAQLYLNEGKPQFGKTLRCSACHTSGGPIMKELAAPHNDWWTANRPLSFVPNKLSSEVAAWVNNLGDAADFSYSVKTGIARLEQSPQYQNVKQQFSLQATLRPLFCETEINLESDVTPLTQSAGAIKIPGAWVVNPFLARGPLSLQTSAYQQLLNSFAMKFPETNNQDADHAWLVPVKGYSDLVAIHSLIKNGTVSEEFVADVLAVDFKNPVLSKKRCNLLKLVPAQGLAGFADILKSSPVDGASELYENLTNAQMTRAVHMKKAQDHLVVVQKMLNSTGGGTQLFKKVLADRQAVFNAEISKNPLGQILEPGFRVIFPEAQ